MGAVIPCSIRKMCAHEICSNLFVDEAVSNHQQFALGHAINNLDDLTETSDVRGLNRQREPFD